MSYERKAIYVAIIIAVVILALCLTGLAQADDGWYCVDVTQNGQIIHVCMSPAEAIRLGWITPMPTVDAYPGLTELPPAAYPGLDVFSGGESNPTAQPTRMEIVTRKGRGK